MSEIKTLNGYELVDEKAREDIASLKKDSNVVTEIFNDGDVIHADKADAAISSVLLCGKTTRIEATGKNLCSAGTVSFTHYIVVEIEPIPAGTYIASALVTSSDTDGTKSAIQYMNGDTLLTSQGFYRDSRWADYVFTVDKPITALRLYANDAGWVASQGDTCTFADIQIEVADGLSDYQVTRYEPYGATSSETGVSPSVSIGSASLSADTDPLYDGDTLDFVTGKIYRADTGAIGYVSVNGSVSGLRGDLVIQTENTTRVTYKKNSESASANNAMKLFGNKVRYFGIAGACGSGLSQCAEAIVQCAHCGMDGVEVDVRLAADGTVVIMHNEDISSTVNAESGTLVSTQTLEQLKQYNFLNEWIQYGYYEDVKMITLDECIQLCKKYGLLITIDIKSDGYDATNQTTLLDNIIEVCTKHGVQDSVVYTSLLAESRKYIRSKLPNAHIAVKDTISNTTVEADIEKLLEVGGNVLMQVEGDPGEDILTPERLAMYHKYGAPVKDRDYIFTYDKPAVNDGAISYVFQFTTADNGATWTVDTDKSSEEAAATTTLTLSNDVYSFVNHCLPPHLLSVASPVVSVMDDQIGQYAVTIQDYSGVKFRRVSGDTPTKITIRLTF